MPESSDANRRVINQARMRHATVSEAHGAERPDETALINALEVASLLLIGDDEIKYAYYVAEISDAPNFDARLFGLGPSGVLMAGTTIGVQSDAPQYPGFVRYLHWRDAREVSLTGVGGFVRGMDGRGVGDRPRRATLAVTFADTGEVVELPSGPYSSTSLRLTFDELLEVMEWIRAAAAR